MFEPTRGFQHMICLGPDSTVQMPRSEKDLYVEVPPRLSITSIGKEKKRGLGPSSIPAD